MGSWAWIPAWEPLATSDVWPWVEEEVTRWALGTDRRYLIDRGPFLKTVSTYTRTNAAGHERCVAEAA